MSKGTHELESAAWAVLESSAKSFGFVATAQEKVKLANDLLLINHLKLEYIDNIDKIDDKFFKSITSTDEEKKIKF